MPTASQMDNSGIVEWLAWHVRSHVSLSAGLESSVVNKKHFKQIKHKI